MENTRDNTPNEELNKTWAYPGATLAFIFTNLSFLFWANLLGLLGDGANLALGVVQLGVFFVYMAGSLVLLKRGQDFEGNVFFVFAAFFGGVGGLTNVVGAIADFLGMPFAHSAAGICWLLCGIFLLLILPGARKNPKIAFAFYVFGGVGLVFMGLLTLGILAGAFWTQLIAWSLFLAGVCGLLVVISTMNGFEGKPNLPPLGKPFFKD